MVDICTHLSVRFEKYEGTVILGLAVFAVVAVTSFLPRAVMTIALVVVVVVFLLVWKKVKRECLQSILSSMLTLLYY